MTRYKWRIETAIAGASKAFQSSITKGKSATDRRYPIPGLAMNYFSESVALTLSGINLRDLNADLQNGMKSGIKKGLMIYAKCGRDIATDVMRFVPEPSKMDELEKAARYLSERINGQQYLLQALAKLRQTVQVQ